MTHAPGPLLAALRFLTLLPLGSGPGAPPPRTLALFPVAGLVVGAAGVTAGFAAEALWGAPLRGIAVVLAWIAVTGGLHWDGLADTCDALLSWRPRERRLEILRDSRLGTMGALGLAAVLALQVAALQLLGPHWWRAALVAPVWGRWAAAWGALAFAPARTEGLGRAFHDSARRGDAGLATGLTLLPTAAVWFPWGAAAGVAVVPVALALGRGMARALGGSTGDTCGALCEAAETAALLALAAVVRHGLAA